MLKSGFFAIVMCLLLTSSAYPQSATANAQSSDQRAILQQKLESEFKLTKVSADKTDVVTAGSVLVLHKDGLVMCSVETRIPPTNTYKNGKVGMGFGSTLGWGVALGTTTDTIPQRKFVAGEKFWLTAFNIQDDGVMFQFISDPYQDVRYYGLMKVPFPKHTMPPADDVLRTIAEVITAQPDDNAAQSAPQQQAQAPAPAAKPMPTIAPPPPPADEPPPQPKTISIGQTKEVVVAILGQPQKVVNLGTKEIDYYPDMKVIFLHGKVSDVQ